MMQSQEINELATALAKAQGEITFAAKDSINPHFKSKYADLASVWEACRGPLSKNGLSIVQTMDYVNNQLILVTTLMHCSGQWMKSVYPILTQRQDPQAYGAAVTYARRYCLAAISGIAQDDSDAEEAMERKPKKISKSQGEEIEQVLNECDPEYKKTVMNFLNKKGINNLKDLTVEIYEKLFPAALANRETYQTQEVSA